MDIDRQLADVELRIQRACEAAGRSRSELELVAVSKQQSVDRIRAAYDLGVRVFGESRPQELAAKATQLPDDIRWHFIGPLQRNKVRQVRPVAELLHSLDRMELAAAWMKGPGVAPPVLLQVHIGDEPTKHGFESNDVAAALQGCDDLGLRVVGLMTIPPPVDTPDAARPFFAELREIRDRLNRPDVRQLSMGMSNDFEAAIAEGASCIRVGSAIFGTRTT